MTLTECGTWVIEGTTAEVQESSARQDIYDLLAESEDGLRPKQVAGQLKKNYHTTKNLIYKMANEGVLTSLNGVYTVAESPRSSVDSVVHSPVETTGTADTDYKTTETTVDEAREHGANDKEQMRSRAGGRIDGSEKKPDSDSPVDASNTLASLLTDSDAVEAGDGMRI